MLGERYLPIGKSAIPKRRDGRGETVGLAQSLRAPARARASLRAQHARVLTAVASAVAVTIQ
jgi:hypothetical protein